MYETIRIMKSCTLVFTYFTLATTDKLAHMGVKLHAAYHDD